MASFALEDAEIVLYRQRVRSARDPWLACELILTDRRIVLTAQNTKPSFATMFGALGVLLQQTRKSAISHQIRREDFASAEVTGKHDLKIDSKGEGYGKVWFEISTHRPQEWADRLGHWVAGTLSAATLPTATLVER